MATVKRKTWIEKRETGKNAEVKKSPKDFADIKAGEKMLIANPVIIDAYIRSIPKGKESSLMQMRKDLAAEYHAHKTCPVTSGIFLRIVAEAAYEEYENGKPLSKIAPFWRIINKQSPTLKKLSFGSTFVVQQRKKEGLDKK